MLTETAWAKINLALHVRARRADGYHDIESLFAFARDGDILAAEPADTLSLTVRGPFADALEGEGEDNLVLRAARGLQQLFGIAAGARLTLDKRIPVAAGLGGGSADAAAALRLLARLWHVDAGDPRVLALAAQLGADVPACLASQTLRGEARGDTLLPVDGDALSGMPLLLANPRIALTTGPVFRGWDGVDRGALAMGDPLAAALAGRNDLEAPAVALVSEIGGLVELLAAQPGVVLARMSGSGASCFALFRTPAARTDAAAALRTRWPHYWCLETTLK